MVVDLGRDLAHTFARKEKVLVAAPWLTLLDHATSPYARPRTPEEFCGHLGHHRAVFSGSDADHPIAPAVKLYEERAPIQRHRLRMVMMGRVWKSSKSRRQHVIHIYIYLYICVYA